jgi:hypothetical protein
MLRASRQKKDKINHACIDVKSNMEVKCNILLEVHAFQRGIQFILIVTSFE